MTDEVIVTEDKRKQTYEPKECQHCHKMVSGKAGPYAMHTKNCERKLMAGIEPKPEKVDKPLKVKTTMPEVQPKTDDIKKVMERAIAYQKEMLKAPEAFTATISHDENWQLRKAYAPETIPRYDRKGNELSAADGGHTHTAYIGDARAILGDIAKGYVPKLNEHGEYVVNHGGDILYTRPRQITEKIIMASQMESRRRVHQATQEATTKSTAHDVPLANDGDVKEQEFGRTGRITIKAGEI